MPDASSGKGSKSSSKKDSSGKKPRSGEKSSSERPSSSKTPSASDAARRAKDTAKTVGDGAGKAYDTVAGVFGGDDGLDQTTWQIPLLPDRPRHRAIVSVTRRPTTNSRFIPLFQWPLDFVARYLGFIFLYHSGLDELKAGFESGRRAPKVKSLLTVFILSSAMQLVPNFLFNTYYHFGALWSFFLPVILFITPWQDAPDQTIATLICDTFFSSGAVVIGSLIPDSMGGENGQNMMTTWHNLLAIWLWRFLVSAIEGISIPGLISVIGLILHYIPSYFLWMTGFMFAMLMTKKTEKRHRADTWYARWLVGAAPSVSSSTTKPSSSSSSSSGTRSGSSRSQGDSSRKSSSSSSRERRK
ncbi:hypothetical protein CI109_104235 [Kwoniella shandongensis]|uniref:Uncharacterized protein n=1 Tax=Kwoniella shandongensis TaxID=1734106 RepID=A0AAJ8LJN4_9TREE